MRSDRANCCHGVAILIASGLLRRQDWSGIHEAVTPEHHIGDEHRRAAAGVLAGGYSPLRTIVKA